MDAFTIKSYNFKKNVFKKLDFLMMLDASLNCQTETVYSHLQKQVLYD